MEMRNETWGRGGEGGGVVVEIHATSILINNGQLLNVSLSAVYCQ